ncbi:hypothetical protein J4423_05030 [Candidatus Pacearchaeota archaeon]|nr:hypothetical protein [Candidatus Pacearchaeota archaeon]
MKSNKKLIDFFSPSEDFFKMIFEDEKGRKYKPLELTNLGNKRMLFVAYQDSNENGHIELERALEHNHIREYSRLRIV